MKKINLIIIYFIAVTIAFTTCKKLEHLTLIKTISYADGIATGEIVDLSSVSHPVYGFCWATTPNPTVSNETVELSNPQVGIFSSNVTPSTAGTWYLRVFIQEGNNMIYGNQITFQFIIPQAPTVTTSSVSNITLSTSTASCGGNVTSDGGTTVTARGVCWSTNQNPTISNSKTINGSGTGSFTSSITGLSPNTTYYVRAYATNSAGTTYGSQVSFTTNQISTPTVTTSSVSSITSSTASCGGSITADGGATVTARGVCWSTNQNPTIANSKTIDGSGTGSFTSSITGLTTNITYYVRAYATNSAGTVYGNQQSFITIAAYNTITDVDGNTYNKVTIGTQVWMGGNLKTTRYNDGTGIPLVTDNNIWNGLTTAGRCYNYNDSLTYKNSYGALYNWFTVNSGKLCPTGWHVPSLSEWKILEKFLDNTVDTNQSAVMIGTDIGDKLKESGITHWGVGNTGTNSSGFCALPGAYRGDNGEYLGEYSTNSIVGMWWSSLSQLSYPVNAWCIGLVSSYSQIENSVQYKEHGYSIRCVKNY